MSKQASTTETVLLPESDLISLALVAVEIGETVDQAALLFTGTVVLDDVGMQAIPASAARRFFTERAEWKARFEEEEKRRRMEEEAQKIPVSVGVPAVEGLTAFETVMAADDYQTPRDEFGNPRVDWLADELESSARRRREEDEQAAREKARLADQTKKDLQ